ncbi:hypothetical protein SAMN06313486_10731 [Epsilonproteobacteria bacterium SCGC AD-308-P11]|nr:hypothetical protein SAMN06313486_10731 [Epsilonproteobacteria bacterium SCGC AD-308-P11]
MGAEAMLELIRKIKLDVIVTVMSGVPDENEYIS